MGALAARDGSVSLVKSPARGPRRNRAWDEPTSLSLSSASESVASRSSKSVNVECHSGADHIVLVEAKVGASLLKFGRLRRLGDRATA
eukprot:COSAG02_NODE_708_length_18231_cov_53.208416_12_plen_88_part_00